MPAKKAKKKTAKKKVSKKTAAKKKTSKMTVKKISLAQAGKAVKNEVKKLVKEIEALTKEEKPKKTKKKTPKCPTLKKAEFDNFYALSFIVPRLDEMRPGEVKKVLGELETFAKRLILVTHHACCGELEHAENGGDCDYGEVKGNYTALLLKYGGARVFYEKLRMLEIPLEECAALFYALGWDCAFGGEAWALIAEAAAKLEKMLPVFESNAKEIMTQIDHLIDLEHNNALFLEDFTDFSIYAFLDEKSSEDYECEDVSPAIKKLVEKYHGPLVPEKV